MSDLVYLDPNATLEQQQEYAGALGKHSATLLPSLVSRFLAGVSPDPKAGPAGYIPGTGLVEYTGGLVNDVYKLVGGLVPPITDTLGITPKLQQMGVDVRNPPSLPLLERAGQRADALEERIYENIPHAQLTPEEAPNYQADRDIGKAIGSVIPIPGLAAITGLNAATKPLRAVLPTSHGALVNLPLAGAAGATVAALRPNEAEAAQDSFLGKITEPNKQEAPTSFLGRVDQSPIEGGPVPSKDESFLGKTITPTIGGDGTSDWTIGGSLLGLASVIGLGLAARYTHGLSNATTAAIRDARMAAAPFADAAQAFNAQRDSITQAGNLGPRAGQGVDAPLPRVSRVQQMATKAKNGLLDENELAKNYVELSADNPSAGQKLSQQIGDTFDETSWQNKLRQFQVTGVDRNTGISMPSLEEYYRKLGKLSSAEKDLFARGRLSANEIDNRNKNIKAGAAVIEHDFPGATMPQLQQHVADMMNNPKLAALATEGKIIDDAILDIGVQRGFFSAQEVADMKATHPGYVPEVGKDGRILHAMGPRDTTPRGGIEQINGDPWFAQAQHIELLMRQYELNSLRRGMVDHILNWQRNTNAPRILDRLHNYPGMQNPSLYPTVAAQSAGARDFVIGIRRGTGVTEWYRINDPVYYNMFKTDNPSRFHSALGVMETARQLVQSGTTGLLATATGRMFPLVNVSRTFVQGPAYAQKGYATGLADAALQAATRGKVNLRVPDPTSLAGAGYAFARGRADAMALHLSKMFDKSHPTLPTQMLNSILAPATMDRISNTMKNYYLSTATHEMRSYGLGGQGVPFRTRPPAIRQGKEGIRLVAGQLNPKTFMPEGKYGTIKAHWLNVQNAAEELFSELSDSMHQYYYRVNRFRGMDPETNAYLTRNLIGNPANTGNNVVMKGIRSTVPYANVSLQGLSRLGTAVKERPLATTLGITSTLGSLALLSLYTAMKHPEAMDYLQNVISLQSRAANVHIFGNDDPSIHAEYSLPQEYRAPYAYMLDVLSKALHVEAARNDADVHDGVYGFLKDWFSQHVSNDTWGSALHGVADAANILELPTLVKAVAAGAGANPQIDLERIVQDIRNGTFNLKTLYTPLGADRNLPNQPPGDALFDGQDASKYRAMISSIFGIFGSVWDGITGLHDYHRQGHDWMESLGHAFRNDWIQKAMDANPNLNSILWENPVRASRRPPIIESVQRQLDALKPVEGARTEQRMEGFTGSGRAALPVTTIPGESKAPKDPIVADLYQRTASELAYINKLYIPQIQAMRIQMDNEAKQMVDNRARREWENRQVGKIAEKYRQIQNRLDDLNAQLSGVIGKPVRADRIHWDQGVEQFGE